MQSADRPNSSDQPITLIECKTSLHAKSNTSEIALFNQTSPDTLKSLHDQTH